MSPFKELHVAVLCVTLSPFTARMSLSSLSPVPAVSCDSTRLPLERSPLN
jgi:hypothetical protein